jgi:hypothetical protein
MNAKLGTIWAVGATIALSTLAPVANANQQGNKNMWRNLGIGSAVIAGHGLLTHNKTEAILGVAGAAYSAHRYEQDRHSQSEQRSRRRYYYQHHHHFYVRNGVRHYY